jgi:hypothetical protein
MKSIPTVSPFRTLRSLRLQPASLGIALSILLGAPLQASATPSAIPAAAASAAEHSATAGLSAVTDAADGSLPWAADGERWWSRFQDPTLNLLQAVRIARGGEPAAPLVPGASPDVDLVLSYIGERSFALRLRVAQEGRDITARQLAVARQSGSTPTPMLNALSERLQRMDGLVNVYATKHDEFAAHLAQLTGLSAAGISRTLPTPSSIMALPVVHAAVPLRLPASLAAGLGERAGNASRVSSVGTDAAWIYPISAATASEAAAQPAHAAKADAHAQRLGAAKTTTKTVARTANSAAAGAPAEDVAATPEQALARSLTVLGASATRTLNALARLESAQRQEGMLAVDAPEGRALELERLERQQATVALADAAAEAITETALAWVDLFAQTRGQLLPEPLLAQQADTEDAAPGQ